MIITSPNELIDIINNGHFKFVDSGPLHSPIKSFTLKRSKDLKLTLTTVSNSEDSIINSEHPVGTVRMVTEQVELTNAFEQKLTFNGVLPSGRQGSDDDEGLVTWHEVSTVGSIKAILNETSDVSFIIEGLANVDDGYYLFWPDGVKIQNSQESKTTLGSPPNSIEIFKEQPETLSYSNSCILFKLNGLEFYLVKESEDYELYGVKSGYILYLGNPSIKIRRKIRDSLSFILGRPLIKTSLSSYSLDWKLLTFEVYSTYTMNSAAFSINTSPPAPLGRTFCGEVNREIVTHFLEAIYNNYDSYRFDHLSWAYWHAICAPVHVAAIHFGSCIESLQKSYIAANTKLFQTKLIKRKEWTKFREGALELVQKLDLEPTEQKVLQNKINSLNITPQSILTKRFLETLNLHFSEIEQNAWQRRNDAAHDVEVEEGTELQLIRELAILKVLFNRVFLKIIEGSKCYIDYSSINFPIKAIEDSIENTLDH